MERIHFLNVKNGDCSWIQHASGRNTVIDICNANTPQGDSFKECSEGLLSMALDACMTPNFSGHFRYKELPTNPIHYFVSHDMPKDIFRFILTHPDMDHMDGLDKLLQHFDILNFWDTDNVKQLNEDSFGSQYNYKDWKTYQNLRNKESNPRTLKLYSGDQGKEYMNDGLEILSPTSELVRYAKEHDDYNTSSYVILYTTTTGRRVLFCGDSDDTAWKNIMNLHSQKLKHIDILIAPHHGRKSGGCSEYLDILHPKLTLFGNANSEHLDYNSWLHKDLCHITNNQAGNVIFNFSLDGKIITYVENEKFAKKKNQYSFYSQELDSWFWKVF